MGRKILGVGLILLLVGAMVLSGCSKNTTSTTNTVTPSVTTTTTTAATNVPVLGGTVTAMLDVGNQDPPSWDVHLSPNGGSTSVWVQPYIEWMACGDIDQFGPRGSNVFSFNSWQHIPTAYQKGLLATSWEMSPDAMTLTFNLRHNVMWTGNTNIGMAAREFTADDAAFSGNRAINAPSLKAYFDTWCVNVVAKDRYTVVWNFKSYQADWEFFNVYGGSNAAVFAPESDKAGGADWKNAVGTGPFIFTDYVSGSQATFTKNPNYWDKTTINGKQYQMPFIDKLVFPVIPDQATQLAAIRTGQLDWWPRVPYTYKDTLASSSPALVQAPYSSGDITIFVTQRLKSPDLGKLDVRRALFMATDFNTINANVYGVADLLSWPVTAGDPTYTPMAQLPANVQELFTYDTVKAKALLNSAGYANGLKFSITINGTSSQQQDIAASFVAQWAKVGITANIISLDATAMQAARNNSTFDGVLAWNISTINPLTTSGYGRYSSMASSYNKGEPIDLEATAAIQIIDGNARNAAMKKLFVDMLTDAAYIPMGNPKILNCYWPWLKNYYGETEAGYHSLTQMLERMWIDQSKKSSLGF
jgi:peptide/nickel transport system substrate-binding protein